MKESACCRPDELVGPALKLPSSGVKQTLLQRRIAGLLGARLIHLLDHLKRRYDVADFVGLAVPDEFHLALFFEEQEAVLIGQRLVGLDVTK
jgi:hypothetical protein